MHYLDASRTTSFWCYYWHFKTHYCPTCFPVLLLLKKLANILSNTYARHSRGHLKLLKTKFKNLSKGSFSKFEYINVVCICVYQRLILGDIVLLEYVIEQVCDGIKTLTMLIL